MADRERLFQLIGEVQDGGYDVSDVVELNYTTNDQLIDHLIANGVTFAADNNVGYKPTTNIDRIRNMSDEELAKFINGGAMYSDSACSYCRHNKEKTCTGKECQGKTDTDIIMEWLKQPMELILSGI